DAWQLAYFGQTGIDPNSDPDNDGMSHGAEYVAGTDPLDPNSSLRITSVQIQRGKAEISWSGGSGVLGYVQRSSDLARTDSWQDVYTNAPSDAIGGNYIDISITNTVNFYRIRVGPQ